MREVIGRLQRHHPRLAVGAWLIVAGLALAFAAARLEVNTDTAALLSPDLPFRMAQARYQREFPLLVDVFVVVVDAPAPEQSQDAAAALAGALARRPEVFAAAEVQGADPWFTRNALLYLDDAQLRDVAESLIAGQAFVGLLAGDPTLRGLATSLAVLLEGTEASTGAGRLLDALGPALGGTGPPVSWQRLLAMQPAGDLVSRRILLVKPNLDFGEVLPAAPAMAALRESIASVRSALGSQVVIRVTGDAALAHEELEQALADAVPTGVAAFCAVAVLLAIGLRSAWLTVACLVVLAAGLALTSGFATIAVGQLNLISLAFAVLYVGLAVDYSLHFCLAYRERLAATPAPATALAASASALRRPLALCTLTTAIGFFAFLPTSFTGVAELGLIAGAGMIVNLAVTFYMLPALLACLPVRPSPRRAPPGRPAAGQAWLARHGRACSITLALASVACVPLLPAIAFDRDPLNLRDPRSESVATLRELLGTRAPSTGGATVLAPGEAAARALVARLEALPEVDAALTLHDFVPEASAAKLAILDELDLLLGPALDALPAATAPDPRATLGALRRLQAAASHYAERHADASARRFATALGERLLRVDEASAAAELERLAHLLTSTLPATLAQLATMLGPDARPADTLPDNLRAQWVSPGGTWRIAVSARESLADQHALRRFVEAVQAVAPDAADEAVLSLRAGDAIVAALRLAFGAAALGITVVLLVVLRRPRQVVAALLPLAGATLLTGASMVLLDLPLNFANVIALPLLLGAGVDYGLHVVERARLDPEFARDPLGSTTSRAIAFSGLTTLAGFGNLMLSSHPGMASMGAVLGIGMTWILLVTLLGLPAALGAWRVNGS